MTTAELFAALHYQDSPNFLRRDDDRLRHVTDYAQAFRHAVRGCRLEGVYGLCRHSAASAPFMVPIVYVCEAEDKGEADAIHRRVWNQNVVPFLIVHTRERVRLYPGFRYEWHEGTPGSTQGDRAILEVAAEFNAVCDHLGGLSARAIDDGAVWRGQWGRAVTPETRVDRQLLKTLEALDERLRQRGLSRGTSHSLIGKFVYLKYLRHREILSDRKLDRWGIASEGVFTREAKLHSFWALMDRLDEWLNGEVFPLSAAEAPFGEGDLRLVARVFGGDEPDGQRHLSFEAYDFSYIPVETLSVIYQQFLHATEPEDERSRGEELGAYYTPVPLVNFMLAELDDDLPLREGMKVLDPACGSGAFLVQCYRRLIERRLIAEGRRRLRPSELRGLLVKHIFGVDRDRDACRVAELSLILTLLDYAHPPDLEHRKRFKLPVLRDRNLFESDFFDPSPAWSRMKARTTFDWVVGNPPWVKLEKAKDPDDDPPPLKWIKANAVACPVGDSQLAEAFAWDVAPQVAPEGRVALLLPAASLFNGKSRPFRRSFFRRMRVRSVVNLANLRRDLFAGRAVAPAAAFFYAMRKEAEAGDSMADEPTLALADERILTYAPFVASQEANRPKGGRRREATWSISINAAEVRTIPATEAATGDMLPWKLAMWGSHRDAHLLRRLRSGFPTLATFLTDNALQPGQGFPLRSKAPDDAKYPTKFVEELVGKWRLDVKPLRRFGEPIFAFPSEALSRIPRRLAYLRLRSGKRGLEVSRPPHIILDAAGRFAVYSDDFIAFPQPSLGVSGAEDRAPLLRALSLYLSSDAVKYHRFFHSPEWGVRASRATKSALDVVPIPLENLTPSDLDRWNALHSRLVVACEAVQAAVKEPPAPLFGDRRREAEERRSALIEEMNREVDELLGLRDFEVELVRDLLHVRLRLNDGMVNEEILAPPSVQIMTTYLAELRAELDAFVQGERGLRHEITAVYGDLSAMVSISLRTGATRRFRPRILRADEPTAKEFAATRERLRRQHSSQWLYFDRELRVYDGTDTYLFKPMQQMLWTKSRALIDAGEVIAETLSGAGD